MTKYLQHSYFIKNSKKKTSANKSRDVLSTDNLKTDFQIYRPITKNSIDSFIT